eukprot:GHUV01007467.1.p1 GENE.GHUV01007467.1~~GHUV01007467.1.p1  ORF type:complete len:382 (+),score=99.86 GHUV01007467.1:2601-3746(+)
MKALKHSPSTRSIGFDTSSIYRKPGFKPRRGRNASAVRVLAAAGQPKPLVVVGSVNADLVLRVDRLPQPGETIAAKDMQFFPGGKGANQAVAAAKLGYPTFFIGNVGNDSYAQPLAEALESAGVTTVLQVVPGPTGSATILLQKNGENSIVIVGGANQQQFGLSSPATKELIANAGAVLLQREIPEVANLQAATIASSADAPVFLDTGGAGDPLSPELLQRITLISPNETELQRLSVGMPTGSEQELLAAAAALQHAAQQAKQGRLKRQPGATDTISVAGLHVLLKLGTAGSMYVPAGADDGTMADGVVKQAAVPATKLVDTTGAGDCFTAAYAVGVLEGMSTADAMRFAAAAASICVSRPGAQPSMPNREEVDQLLDRIS